jgi:hypothetical protein
MKKFVLFALLFLCKIWDEKFSDPGSGTSVPDPQQCLQHTVPYQNFGILPFLILYLKFKPYSRGSQTRSSVKSRSARASKADLDLATSGGK